MKLRVKSQTLITLAQWVISPIFAPQINIMKFYNTIIKYRFWLSLLALVAAVGVNISSGFWPSFTPYNRVLYAEWKDTNKKDTIKKCTYVNNQSCAKNASDNALFKLFCDKSQNNRETPVKRSSDHTQRVAIH